MVAVDDDNNENNKKQQLLSRLLFLLGLKETLDATAIPSSSRPIHPPSEPLQIEIPKEEKGPTPPESDWMITVREKLELAKKDDVARTRAKLCIYKVPHYLRKGEDKAYIPNIVSLGPYHHGRKRFRSMDRHKWRAFHQILKRGNHDAKLYVDAMKELEERVRDCYEGQITTVSSNKFVEMMVLDACFVLELFCGAEKGFKNLGYSPSDPVFTTRGSMHLIQRDMIMLENQIPLFVLDRLLGLGQPEKPEQKGLVAKLALKFFDSLMPNDGPLTKSDRNGMESTLFFEPLSADQSNLHCLHVFRQSLLRKGPQIQSRSWMKRWSLSSRVADKCTTQLIHCVTELKEAGINFKKRKTDRFWDIEFKNGVLKIPRLLIHDGTKSLFLNLIAFEQTHLNCGNEITSYVIFMDTLINSQADVGYLHYCGIIEHWLGSDAEVADLFNQLCQEVDKDINNSYLSELSGNVNRYYNHRWNSWRASLMHNYFSNPWAIISLFAALILLILTAAQTFYGVYGYYNPS